MDIHPWTGVNTFLAREPLTAEIEGTGLRETDICGTLFGTGTAAFDALFPFSLKGEEWQHRQ